MPSSTTAPNVLIIDDHSPDARLTLEALQDGADGHHFIAKDAREALAYLRKEAPYAEVPTPDVIILGFNPPARAGQEAFEGIRTIAQSPPGGGAAAHRGGTRHARDRAAP